MDAEQQSSHSPLWMRNKDKAGVVELLFGGRGVGEAGNGRLGLVDPGWTSPHPDDECVETEAEHGQGCAGCLTAALGTVPPLK